MATSSPDSSAAPPSSSSLSDEQLSQSPFHLKRLFFTRQLALSSLQTDIESMRATLDEKRTRLASLARQVARKRNSLLFPPQIVKTILSFLPLRFLPRARLICAQFDEVFLASDGYGHEGVGGEEDGVLRWACRRSFGPYVDHLINLRYLIQYQQRRRETFIPMRFVEASDQDDDPAFAISNLFEPDDRMCCSKTQGRNFTIICEPKKKGVSSGGGSGGDGPFILRSVVIANAPKSFTSPIVTAIVFWCLTRPQLRKFDQKFNDFSPEQWRRFVDKRRRNDDDNESAEKSADESTKKKRRKKRWRTSDPVAYFQFPRDRSVVVMRQPAVHPVIGRFGYIKVIEALEHWNNTDCQNISFFGYGIPSECVPQEQQSTEMID